MAGPDSDAALRAPAGGVAAAVPPQATADAAAQYRRAVGFVLMSSCLLSFNGLILRQIDDASAWQVIFYRSAALGVAMSLLFVFRHRRRALHEFRRAGINAMLAGALIGLAGVCFIQALSHTTVANTLFTLSSVPMFAAVFAWAILGERVRRATWIAIGVSMVGIAVMVADGFGSGTVIGNLLALATAVLFALYVVALRRNSHVDMLASVCWAAFFSMSIGGIVAADLAVSLHDVVLCILWGACLSCAGHALFTLGSRHVPAAEITLIALIEMMLGPLWVWLFVDEVPGALTLAGGAVVFAAIVGWSLARRRAGA